jgi:hypothetical protein
VYLEEKSFCQEQNIVGSSGFFYGHDWAKEITHNIHIYAYIYICVCKYICIHSYTYIHTYASLKLSSQPLARAVFSDYNLNLTPSES